MANYLEGDNPIKQAEEILRTPIEPTIDLELPYDTAYRLVNVINLEVDAAKAFEKVVGASIKMGETSVESIHTQLLRKFEGHVDTNPDQPDTPLDQLLDRSLVPIRLSGTEVDFMNGLLLRDLNLSGILTESVEHLLRPDYLGRFLPEDARIIAEAVGRMKANRPVSDAANMRTLVQLNEHFQNAGGKPRQKYVAFREGQQ